MEQRAAGRVHQPCMHGDRNDVAAEDADLGLLGFFRCRVGGRDVRLAPASRRLIVTVALEPGGLGRESLQGRLWPDAGAAEAAKRLRQSLWRVRRDTGARLLAVTSSHVALADHVDVDLRRGERLARLAARGAARSAEPDEVELLGRELLPCLPEEDVWAARDRWDLLRLLALERLAEHALASGDTTGAIDLAEAAARVDALAEASHRIRAAAHLVREDQVSAWRVFTRYRRLLDEEMGLQPSAAFRGLLERDGRTLVS
ncbi:DNA-binding transcriptional activator of the SARP family [Actinomadura glauciflava]|nr:DNA-binding transcriptional activator of the SARP family [Actinomadura glauciflava]